MEQGQVSPLWTRVNLGIMMAKRHSSLLKTAEPLNRSSITRCSLASRLGLYKWIVLLCQLPQGWFHDIFLTFLAVFTNLFLLRTDENELLLLLAWVENIFFIYWSIVWDVARRVLKWKKNPLYLFYTSFGILYHH